MGQGCSTMGELNSPMVSMGIPLDQVAASCWWTMEDQRQPTQLGRLATHDSSATTTDSPCSLLSLAIQTAFGLGHSRRTIAALGRLILPDCSRAWQAAQFPDWARSRVWLEYFRQSSTSVHQRKSPVQRAPTVRLAIRTAYRRTRETKNKTKNTREQRSFFFVTMSVVVSSDSASEYRGSEESYSPGPNTPGPRTRATTQSSNRASQTGANRATVHRSHGTSDQSPSPAPDTPGPRTRVTTQSTNREPQTGPVRPTVRRTHGAGGRLPAGPQRGDSTRAAPAPGRGASRPRPANLPGVPSRARATALSTRQATAVQPTGNEADPQGAWPPATVHLTVDDEPINDEFVSEVDAIFQLGGSYADLGEQLAYVPLPRQYVVGIYGLLSVRQAIERLRHDILHAPRGPGAASAEVSMVSQAQNFHYVAVFSVSLTFPS
ncbi:hypothetical protein PGTUg99_005349 [Puccinia graminis f. sp. tritici]|uniref:Uncharacterized protein n=1 Tax=Puccinia graminis f. sp. tritici TaxID=56615 RepID=A0A5B0QDY4_PUCGR|nr:hypothetical protein PGTUg99_005349 [Puccinia graminis f. sp. tritici]